MYSAVLLLAAACASAPASVWAWIVLAMLAAVLTLKAVVEERWMAAMHPDYADYCRHTRRFAPGIF